MTSRKFIRSVGGALLAFTGACDVGPVIPVRDIATNFAFTNFSTTKYAAIALRESGSGDADAEYFTTPLLPPGATFRMRFLDAIGVECPGALDVRIVHYRRLNDDVPIGLDLVEAVEPTPIVAGEIANIPACAVQVLETLTIVNWEAPDGVARVKFAQGTAIEAALAADSRFDNVDIAWETEGIDASIPLTDSIDQMPPEPITGRVLDVNGNGVENIGVLIRTRFRVRLNDNDPANDPDAGFSTPIAVTQTDADGRFSLDRPPGGYRVEFFSDDWLFRPAIIDVESPQTSIITIVEPVN